MTIVFLGENYTLTDGNYINKDGCILTEREVKLARQLLYDQLAGTIRRLEHRKDFMCAGEAIRYGDDMDTLKEMLLYIEDWTNE